MTNRDGWKSSRSLFGLVSPSVLLIDVIISLSVLFLPVQSQFLYVPQGRPESEGVVLKEIRQDQLPPGEYEVLALFDTPPGKSAGPEQGRSSPFELPGISIDHTFVPTPRPAVPPNVLALTNNGPSPFELPTGLGSSPANPTHLNPAISLQPPSADFYPPTPPPKQRFPPQRRPQQKFEHFPDRFEAAEDASVVRKRNIQPEASRSLFDQSDEVLEFRRQKQKYLEEARREYQSSLSAHPNPVPQYNQNPSTPSRYYDKYDDLTYRKQELEAYGYDPRLRSAGPELPEPDHWSGYDPDYTRNRFSPSLVKAKSEVEDDGDKLFVTPLPPTKMKHHTKRKIQRQRVKNEGLEKLQSIAAPRPKVSKDFVCPRDGHFGDKNDCAKFYRCAHGDALVEYCPGGLFWNAVTDQCDWPETVDCSYNSVAMETYKVKSPVTLYMTFDDGPNEGTDAILAALRKAGVKATFFINSRNIHDPDPRVVARNVKSILTMIKDGHVLADHSYDHMYHNSKNSPKDAYVNLEEDIKYFGIMNTYPILDMLWKADLKPYIGPVNHTMTYYVRMPYTNNWRIGGQHRDCYHCTIPASSGQLGVAITNSLHNQGKYIVGWDMEWEIDWNRNRFKYGGKEMFFKMARDQRFMKPKMVILSHDIAHRPYEIRDEQKELEEFLELSKTAGYKFDTIDNYLD